MKKIRALLKEMTLREKASLLIGATAWTTAALPRLEVPAIFMADGPHGVRRLADEESLGIPGLPATCFPCASCLAATWNAELIGELGRAIGDEARALGVSVLLAPGVNIKRHPLCGRNFEYYSEDPFLAGEMAVAFINGVQSRGVGTSLKHFAVNNQEFERFSINVDVDERALREIYLAAFETAVRRARPWTVMGSYNRVNGERVCENGRLLDGILRGEWGFDGVTVSDWGAVHDRVKSLEAGLDLEMPGPRDKRRRAVERAVRTGRIPERLVDRAAARVLKLVERCAAASSDGVVNAVDAEAHHRLARRIAGEGFVLLKNKDLLPLSRPARVAVIGRTAAHPYIRGGGSSFVTSERIDVPLDEIRRRAGEAEVTYDEGWPEGPGVDQGLIDEACGAASRADVAILFAALNEHVESESYDRADMKLPAHQETLIRAVCAAQPRTVVVLGNGGVVEVGAWSHAPAAVLEAWMTGQAGGGALADVLWGDVNPSGKLAETIPLKLSDTPAFNNFPGENGAVRYGEGLFIGYRFYERREQAVAFPFGHGLSYTTFAYENLGFSSDEFVDADGLIITFDLVNTGPRAGRETAQVYVRDCVSTLVRPVKELKGFCKTALEPGERKRVSVALDFRSFAFYHPVYRRWITEDGEFEILVGASSADIRLRGTVRLRSRLRLPSLLTPESSTRLWHDDPHAHALVLPLLERIKEELMGREENKGGAHGMDMLGFMMETPLKSLLELWEKRLGLDAEDTIKSLFRRLNGEPEKRKKTRRKGKKKEEKA